MSQSAKKTPVSRPDSLAKAHQAHSSIRGQNAQKQKKAKEQKRNEAALEAGSSGQQQNKEGRPFVKAVLADPLAAKW